MLPFDLDSLGGVIDLVGTQCVPQSACLSVMLSGLMGVLTFGGELIMIPVALHLC